MCKQEWPPSHKHMRFFAVVAPGLESALEKELLTLDVAEPAVTVGGIEFSGDLGDLYRANLTLRTATRILVRLGCVKARDFVRLRKRVAELPWEKYVGGPVTLDIAVTAHRSRLFHTGAISERVAGAISDRL